MLNKKTMLILPLLLLALPVFVLAIDVNWAPGPPDGGNEEPPPGTPQKTYDSTLQITEITAKVDGKKDTIQNSGEKISNEAKQESDVEFEINVKNVWDKKIKGVGVEITIEDIDDGDNIEGDENINELSPGDSKKVKVGFNLPLKVDDGNYGVRISLSGKDEDNNLHILNWVSELEVKKEQHNVKITKASIYPSVVQCSRTANLQIEILNLGREEEDVKLEIKNDYLGIDLREEGIELGTGTHDDAEYQKTFSLNILSNTKAGTYPIGINAYYNKERSVVKKEADLVIQNCLQQKQSSPSVKVLPPTPSETLAKLQTKTPNNTLISIMSDESLLLLLTIIFIIMLGLMIFLFGAIIMQLRK